MEKKFKLIFSILAVLIVLVVGLFVFVSRSTSINHDSALLLSGSDVVVLRSSKQVNVDNLPFVLYKDDVVRTNNDSASISIKDSIVVSLDPYSEVSLKDISNNITVVQTKGRVWNKITKLLGVTSYHLVTPSAVASVRGTMFSSDLSDKDVVLLLVEGKLWVGSGKKNSILDNNGKLKIDAEGIKRMNLSDEDRALIKSHVGKMIKSLIVLRNTKVDSLLLKNKAVVSKLSAKTGLNIPSEVRSFFSDLDSHKKSLSDLQLIANDKIVKPFVNKKTLDYFVNLQKSIYSLQDLIK